VLDIKEKEKAEKPYLQDFFGKNINVTAIIGENGSGKSSLLEQLMLLFFSSSKIDIESPNRAWVLTYDKEKEWIDINYFNQENLAFSQININNKVIRKNSIDSDGKKDYFYTSKFSKRKYYNLFYNPSIELVSSSFLSYINEDLKNQDGAIYDLDFKPEQLNIFAFPSKKKRIVDIKKNENNIILTMYKSIEVFKAKNLELKLDELLDNKKLNFLPSSIDFIFNIEETEYLIKHDNQKIKDILFSKYNDLSLESLYAYFIASILSIAREDYDTKKFNDYFFKEGPIKDYLIKTYDELKKLIPNNDQVSPVYKLTNHILTNINDFILVTSNIKLIDSLEESSVMLNADIFETAKLIDALKTLDNVNALNHRQHNIGTIAKILSVMPSYIRVNVYDENNVCFNDYSYGEKNLISLIYSLMYYVHFFSTSDNTINIFLDEIETGLNPKWQRELINILMPFFAKLNISLNIVISSHSPFILSDLPKDNIIFLEKETETGNCKNSSKDIKINPFGANIHTLLSHGFFMTDGLMGQFSKVKINEVIKYLKNEGSDIRTDKEAESIINIIGDEVLKSTLKHKLYSNESKITKLKRQQEEIGKAIELEEQKDNINEES
jgi:predicted ATP-binding protein involved in virulence